MKKTCFLLSFILAVFALHAQTSGCGGTHAPASFKATKIGIVVCSNDPETVWNAFRLANYSRNSGDTVSVFLLGKGVECPNLEDRKFDVKAMMEDFSKSGGTILACGTCLKSRNQEGSNLCPVSSLSDLYLLIRASDIVLTF